VQLLIIFKQLINAAKILYVQSGSNSASLHLSSVQIPYTRK